MRKARGKGEVDRYVHGFITYSVLNTITEIEIHCTSNFNLDINLWYKDPAEIGPFDENQKSLINDGL